MLQIGKINRLRIKEINPAGCILVEDKRISTTKHQQAHVKPEREALDTNLAKSPWGPVNTKNKSTIENEASGLEAGSIDQEEVFLALGNTNTKKDTKPFEVDDVISAFLFYSEDKQVHASLTEPHIQMGDLAALRVINITQAGAFLDWGLPRDLFAPKQHTHSQIAVGMPAVVRLVHHPKERKLFATTKIEQYLEDAPSQWDYSQAVDLLIYSETPLGFKTVINQKYEGLLYKSDLFKPVHIGDTHKGFISKIRDDGKIDVSLQRHDKIQRQSLNAQILEDLKAHGGISSLTDKSSAEDIRTRFNVSKGAYKKALGQLYKSRKITISPDYIKLNKEQ
uniref:CvfB family protein n=1 Tax=Ningiella ruwaisensis TaxID=2364274 RepID=UPI00109FD4BD|nr:hypothetical protein [Ningiella ruwaisensis]